MQDLVRKYAVGGFVPGGPGGDARREATLMQMANNVGRPQQGIGVPDAIGGSNPFAGVPQVGGNISQPAPIGGFPAPPQPQGHPMPPMGSSPQLAQGQQMAAQQAMQPRPPQPPPSVSAHASMVDKAAANKVMQSLEFDPISDASERRRATTEDQVEMLNTLREKYAEPTKPDRADMWARISQAFSGPSETKGISGRLSKTAVSLADWKKQQTAAEEARLMKLMGIDTKIGEAQMGLATRDEEVLLKRAELAAKQAGGKQGTFGSMPYPVEIGSGDRKKIADQIAVFNNPQAQALFNKTMLENPDTDPRRLAAELGAVDYENKGELSPESTGAEWLPGVSTIIDGRTAMVFKDASGRNKDHVMFTDGKDSNKSAEKMEAERKEAFPKVRDSLEMLELQHESVERHIDRALDQASGFTSGFFSLASIVPGGPQADLAETLKSIKANLGFDRLQQMRDSSPTGGALGQVSNFENELLQSVWGSLEQRQSPDQLRQNLAEIKNVLQRTREMRKRAFASDFGDFLPKEEPGGDAATEGKDDLDSILFGGQ